MLRFCRGLIAGFVLWGLAAPHAQAQSRLQPSWKGATPCGAESFYPPLRFSGSEPRQDERYGFHYTLTSDVKIRYIRPVQNLVPLYGLDYEAVTKDIFKRRPILNAHSSNPGKVIILAKVSSKWSISNLDYIRAEGGGYRLNPKTLSFDLSPKITLGDWVSYSTARPDQKELWDRQHCESVHHEMGHVLVTLQILSEHSEMFLNLRASSQKALFAKVVEQQKRTVFAIKTRQGEYHKYIAANPKSLMDSKPYLEHDFPWLKKWKE